MGIMAGVNGAPRPRDRRDLNITLDTPQFAVMRDAAEEALQYVENVRDAATCDGGTGNILNVLFDNTEWKPQANAAVRLSNLLTKNFQITNGTGGYVDDALVFAMTRTTIEIEALAFGSAVAFEPNLYRNMSKFCAYSFHTGNGTIKSHDISVEYDYFPSEWYLGAKEKYRNLTRDKADNITQRLSEYDVNSTKVHKVPTNFMEPRMEYDDGFWTRPYFDCGGGNIWMITFNSPIQAVINGSLGFAGVATVDVALNILDIDQCDATENGKKFALNVFQGTHHCKPSTNCVPRAGFGFRRGTYYCECRPGFYYPNASATVLAFPGFDVENAYADWIQHGSRDYLASYDCNACPEGCETCVDATPCMAEWDWALRSILLIIVVLILVSAVFLLLFIHRHRRHPVLHEAGVLYLQIVCVGAVLATGTDLALFPKPSAATCTSRLWFEHVAFVLIYSLVRRAKKLQPQTALVTRGLALALTVVVLYLAAWSAIGLSPVQMARTGKGLKFYMCQDTWMSDGITIAEGVFLLWGVYISSKVHSVVTPYNEAKSICWVVYITFILKHLLLVTRKFSIGQISPDVLYLLYVLELQVPVTCTFLVYFGPKLRLIRKGTVKPSNPDIYELATEESGTSGPTSPSPAGRRRNQSFAAKLEHHHLTAGNRDLSHGLAMRQSISQ
ncbi:putative G-protein coupled receptor [Hypsibius exemplaris]|uniref:G-protein coupled receptor n=1 Tax=Hypsibius exemplaris TaxID=2072580 RepID=A0A1W0WV59_HYPEX|nr:putative G-protein coupled receptor [Hypsibius exemplaris]